MICYEHELINMIRIDVRDTCLDPGVHNYFIKITITACLL